MLKIDREIFAGNLRLTQEYCHQQAGKTEVDIAKILRSYNPVVNGQPLFSFDPGKFDVESLPGLEFCASTKWAYDPTDHERLVNWLFEQQLIFKKQQADITKGEVFTGDILIAQIDCTVIDGASEVESLGLIDAYDLPPIDTWFYLTRTRESRLLFAWIPQYLRPYANEAVWVNCVDCLGWFQEWYPQEYEMFSRHEREN